MGSAIEADTIRTAEIESVGMGGEKNVCETPGRKR
jgi:hypothetical protein